jgi:hypothetical protein
MPTRPANLGMTIWEWLVLLAIAGSFAAVLAAGANRASIVDPARTLKNELEEIDRVIRQRREAGQVPPGGVWQPEDFRPLVREKFRRLRDTGLDPFGNPYAAVSAGQRPAVPAATAARLHGRLGDWFWSPFTAPDPDAPPPPPDADPFT